MHSRGKAKARRGSARLGSGEWMRQEGGETGLRRGVALGEEGKRLYRTGSTDTETGRRIHSTYILYVGGTNMYICGL